MSDEINLVSTENFASGRNLPQDMVRDLRIVAKADGAAVDEMAKALKKETGILSEERVEELAKQFFDESYSKSIAQTIFNVSPEFVEKILAMVDHWRQVSDNGKRLLPDSDFASLKRNLDALVQDHPGLALMQKARRLLRETGNMFEDAVFICDLRPVFDEQRKQVEGFVALANLRLRYTQQNLERGAFEIELTENELMMLIEQGQKAIDKLTVLKETVRDLSSLRDRKQSNG